MEQSFVISLSSLVFKKPKIWLSN